MTGLPTVELSFPVVFGLMQVVGNSRRELMYDHLLIVFGGVYGLEATCQADPENTAQPPTALLDQFHCYLNLCPTQGSRTIRTEEAVLMCLTALQPVVHPPPN